MELIANCQIQLGRHREAADRLEAVVRIAGTTRERALSLADLYAQLDVPDRAALWLERAYEGDAPMPSADRLRLAYLLLDSGRLEDALAAFEAVPEETEERGEAQGQAAQVELRLARPDAAAARLTGLFAARPRDGGIRLVAGDLHLRAKRYDEALTAYSQAAALPDTAAAGLAGIAETYYEMGNLRKAVESYEKAVEAAPAQSAYRHALTEIRSELELASPAPSASP
jgi:tetratricopeptide (TPR) repeat protein